MKYLTKPVITKLAALGLGVHGSATGQGADAASVADVTDGRWCVAKARAGYGDEAQATQDAADAACAVGDRLDDLRAAGVTLSVTRDSDDRPQVSVMFQGDELAKTGGETVERAARLAIEQWKGAVKT